MYVRKLTNVNCFGYNCRSVDPICRSPTH